MFIQPRLNASLDTHLELQKYAFLLDEHRKNIFQGELYSKLIPLLDGGHDISEILLEIGDQVSLFDVYKAINNLTVNGCLVEGKGNPPLSYSPYLEYVRSAHQGTLKDWREFTINIRSIGATNAALLTSALETLAIKLESFERADLLVVITDDYDRTELNELNKLCLESGKPWLLAKPEGIIVWIGPFFLPTVTGCWACLKQRLTANRQTEKFILEQNIHSKPIINSVAYLPAAQNFAYQLLATQIVELLMTDLNSRLKGHLITFDLLQHEVQEHLLVKRPQCPECGNAKLFEEQMLQPVFLTSRNKRYRKDGGHRIHTPEETYAHYRHHISPILGAVTELRPAYGSDNELTHSYVAGHNFSMGLDSIAFLRESLRGVSGGKGSVKIQAMVSGLCEAIERYSGNYFGDEYQIIATLTELDEAIHPNACLGFSESQFDSRNAWNACVPFSRCHFVPEKFNPDQRIAWTPFWSLTQQKTQYLPSIFCFYGHPELKHSPWCIPDSNGSAAGNTLEEAIIQGFMELVERDAVAIWWYNRIPRRGVDLESFDMPYLQAIKHYYAELNRELWVLDISSDLNIPTFACVSKRLDSNCEDILLGFGAHFDPKIAILRAITEVNQFLPSVALRNLDGTTRYLFGDDLAKQWWKSATVGDHSYLLPDHKVPLGKFDDFPDFSFDDIKQDVEACVELCHRHDLELMVLNQTRPDIGLSVVKVVVPELCHFWRRLGKERLYQVPVKMGWLSHKPTLEDFNPFTIFF